MPALITTVEFLVTISVVITAITSYLIINKLWSRRRLKDVAESISVSAALLGIGTGLPFLLEFVIVDQSPRLAVKQGISLLTGVVFVLVGSGIWVAENRGKSFLRLFLRALNLERRESADLLKLLVQPKGAQEILRILEELARLDRHVDERERALIDEFAQRWKLKGFVGSLGGESGQAPDLLSIRERVVEYLQVDPPREQAAQLLDVLQLLVRADARTAREEELALEEITGLVTRYIADEEGKEPPHQVLIVPQTEEQFEAVRSLLPGHEVLTYRGGRVFSVGRFFSSSYAEVVCDKYIALGLFTTQVSEAASV